VKDLLTVQLFLQQLEKIGIFLFSCVAESLWKWYRKCLWPKDTSTYWF